MYILKRSLCLKQIDYKLLNKIFENNVIISKMIKKVDIIIMKYPSYRNKVL